MKIKRNILFVLFILAGIMSNISAQDLSKMSEADRVKKVKEIAWSVYKHPKVKNFYREYGEPTITEMKTRNLSTAERNKISTDKTSIWYGSTNNQKYYIVYFPYNMNKERFDQNYAANVYIWENTGKAFAIGLGNMMMFPVRNGIPIISGESTPPKECTITYLGEFPNKKDLPTKVKSGELVILKFYKSVSEAEDGWITESGYNFDPNKDIEGPFSLLGDSTENKNHVLSVRTVKIWVGGNLTIKATSYREEYENTIY